MTVAEVAERSGAGLRSWNESLLAEALIFPMEFSTNLDEEWLKEKSGTTSCHVEGYGEPEGGVPIESDCLGTSPLEFFPYTSCFPASSD